MRPAIRPAVSTATARLRARLTLPDATASYKQFGVVPVSATMRFVNDGPTTGRINTKTGGVRSTSRITLRIVSLEVAGVSVPIGNSCETAAAAVIHLASQPGFNAVSGGKLAGTYTIPEFSNCGIVATPLLNATIPGPGNTITLKLGKAKIG